MIIPSDKLRELVNTVISTVESRGLFVHSTDLEIKYTSGKSNSVQTTRFPFIVGSCVLNAIVPRSAMLLVGAHGGGKDPGDGGRKKADT